MVDETPVRIKVLRPSKDGESNLQDSATAKIMAIITHFSCVLKVVQADASVSEEPAFHIIMGELWTELRAMEPQRAGVILKVYEEVGKVPEEELVTALFQETAVMHSTDLCPGMLAMLRGHRQLNPAWNDSHFRCGIHRLRTAELNALKLDARTDSFWMNFSLSLRISSGLWEFRRRAREWAKKVKIKQGEPPPEVLAWREEVLGHFSRRVDADKVSKEQR